MMVGFGKVVKFKNGKKLGIIRKDKTFMTFRKEKIHYFRLYDGWALNKNLLEELRDIGIEWIEIITYDTNMVYRTKLENFFIYGIEYQNQKTEKDYQLVLPIRFWQKFPKVKVRGGKNE